MILTDKDYEPFLKGVKIAQTQEEVTLAFDLIPYVEPPSRKFVMSRPQEDEIRGHAKQLVTHRKLWSLTEVEASKINVVDTISSEEIEAEFNILLEKVIRIFEGGDIGDEYITQFDTYRMVLIEYSETFDIYKRAIAGEELK